MRKEKMTKAKTTKNKTRFFLTGMLLTSALVAQTATTNMFTLDVAATQITESQSQNSRVSAANLETILSNSEPKLIVDSYQIISGQATKGEAFTMRINIRNTNEYADAYNVLMTYTSETDNVRLKDERTNQHYEEFVGAGEVITYEMEFEVLDYFEMDTMIMNFMCTYVDKNGDGYTNSSLITPKINKNCTMKIHALTVADNAVVGAKSLVNVRYSSTGTLPIKSAVMIIEGDILESKKEIELEGVSETEQKSFDYYVNFSSEGEQTLKISFRYMDEEGNEYTLEPKEYSVNVSPYQTTSAKVTKQQQAGFITSENKNYILIGCVAVIVIVLLVSAIWAVKSKDKKGEQ